MSTDTGTQADAGATIAVIRGNPAAEEIAALVGALLTAGPVPAEAARPRSVWWASGLPARPRGWRESGLPA